MNKEHLSIYEVSENKIADDNTCKGIIIRDETVINSANAGYVNYYLRDGERVSKNALVYTIDESGGIYDTLTASENMEALSNTDSDKINNSIITFSKLYSDNHFDDVYNLKYDIDNILYEATNFNMISNLAKIENTSKENVYFHKVTALKSGIISYSIDSMENLTKEDINAEAFLNTDYKRTQLRNKGLLEQNSPIYKIVTSEEWSIIISLTKEQYDRIKEKERIKVTFIKDSLDTAVDITSYQKDDSYFAKLDLDNYMIRYLNDRYIDVELTINSAKGLKIPKSSIVEKDFYKIPLTYFTAGGNSGNSGIIKEVYAENGDVEFLFVSAEKYYEDDDYGYIDTKINMENGQTLKPGDWIHNAETKERYKIGEIGSLEGVYNVNKGYAVFRRIEKEYENKEYCIVKKDTLYGLSVYDHIVLNADKIEEQSIIY